jgi:hypothetical protein
LKNKPASSFVLIGQKKSLTTKKNMACCNNTTDSITSQTKTTSGRQLTQGNNLLSMKTIALLPKIVAFVVFIATQITC